MYWTTFGLMKASVIELYLWMAGLLHISVGLKRTYDINLGYPVSSGKLNMAITGLLLLCFLLTHLMQFRFAATDRYWFFLFSIFRLILEPLS